MLKTIRSGFLALLAVITMPLSAQARPVIDRELLPLLSSPPTSEVQESVLVILRLKDAYALPQSPTNRAGHAATMRAMMKNAQQSQVGIMSYLRNAHQQGQSIKASPIWIVNAIIAKVPVRVFQELANDERLVAIHANRALSLIAPRQDRPERFADAFTYGLGLLQVPELRAKHPASLGTGVPVGILDTGIDANHPDLKGKVAAWKDFTAGNSQTPIDDHGHGTHVGGTVAGGNTSGTSIGVAPGAKLVIGRIFDKSGSTTLAIILAGMQWAADPDGNPDTQDFPVLVSNSWGGGPPSRTADPAQDIECKAVTAWKKLGILPVFAAGNSGPRAGSVGLPGACPDALAIGAVDKDDKVASFSSRGPTTWGTGALLKPDVSGPGVAISSSKPGGGYVSFSGTSMATPHVAGLGALLYQLAPTATVDQIARVIAAGAQDLGPTGPDADFGIGRVNALRSVELLRP